MRKGIIPLLLFIVSTLSFQALAQPTIVVREASDEADMYIKVGALAALTLAMNTTDYHVSNISRSLGVGSHLGVRASIPLGRSTRVIGGLGYHTLVFSDVLNKRISFSEAIENHSAEMPGKLNISGSFQYTVVTAGLQFGQFYMLFSYGLPTSSELLNSGDGFDIPAEGIDPAAAWGGNAGLNPEGRRIYPDISPDNEDINPLLELRVGGEFPLVKSRVGDLNLGISVAYTFNNIMKDSRANLPNYMDQFYLPNVMFHLAYMFNI
jgi:hypothetical protein